MKEKKAKKLKYGLLIGAIFLISIVFGIYRYKEKQRLAKEQIQYDTQEISTIYSSANQEKTNNEENQNKQSDQEKEKETKDQNQSQPNQEDKTSMLEETKEYAKEEVIKEYKGYEVIAKLEIPTIQLETYVLKNYSVEALNVSVTKFWGADPNQIGNFCIAGHNFRNKNMFRQLKKLEVGEELSISDNTVGKIQYEIYDIYTVLPEEVSCLSQETKGKREVTLITCTNDSKKRIIVKAREK